MGYWKKYKLIFVSLLLGASTFCNAEKAMAADVPFISSGIITAEVIDTIRGWVEKPVVFISLDGQNTQHATLKQKDIDALDKQWRNETKSEDQPLIAAVLSNPLSNYLTQIQAASAGLYTEIFVMDKTGLNAGQSSITSDYWQGDEGKFQKTFSVGSNAVFIDDPELNEDSNTWRSQLNITVAQDGKAVGAITVEINLTELQRRQAQ